MRQFKFFKKNYGITRSWWPTTIGHFQWMYRPMGTMFYTEVSMVDGFYQEETKTMFIEAENHHISSFDNFMAMNRNKTIFAYRFIYGEDINHIIYDADNFDDMPRDRPLLFVGIIRSNEVF